MVFFSVPGRMTAGMKNFVSKLNMDRKRAAFAIAAVILMLCAWFAVSHLLSGGTPYVPEDTVSSLDSKRSQVYVSGKDYKLDTKTQKKHKEQQQKRSRILQEEDTHQQTDAERRMRSTKEPPKQALPVKTPDSQPVKTPEAEPAKEQEGRKVKTPPQNKPKPAKDPEDPEGPEGEDEEDDEPPDKENRRPVIKTSLIDGRRMKGSAISFWVTVTDYKNQNVPVFSNGDGHFEVFVNGSKITSSGTNGNKTNFRADVKDGNNKIKIVATDSRKKQSTRILNIKCDTKEEGKPVGTVTVSASAPSLGIGTIFSGVKVDITEQEPLNEVLSAVFKKAGYSAEMTKSYLAGIKKKDIAKNAEISDEVKDRAKEKRVTLIEREDWPKGWQDRLREKDFCSHSGWIYKVNGEMPNVGINAFIPEDGDEIELVFILFDGDMG